MGPFSIILLAPSLTAAAHRPCHQVEDSKIQKRAPGGLVCEPFGICERCPEASLHEPFCQPFGNRRLLHCREADSPDVDKKGELPAWESCGRIVAKERADFFEFVACNAAFAVLGLLVLLARSRRLAYMQARTLAARIGLAPSTGR